MFVTYPDVCWCQLISPSITGLRHYRSGCALLLGARSAHERRDEAHDPRQSWSDTSPPISQAVPGLQSGSDDTHFVLPSSRQPKPGTKLSRLNLSAPKTGKLSLHAQNSSNSTLLDEQGELCHRHNPRFLDRARSVRPQAVRSHVNPLAHTSTGYSIDGRAPHTGPARPGGGARGRWRGLATRNQSLTCRAQLINPRGVAFVPGTAWPAHPLVARATSCARRVASKPGQAPQALRRPPQGRCLLSTLSWPCIPANSAYVQTRPRPVSRPRPRR